MPLVANTGDLLETNSIPDSSMEDSLLLRTVDERLGGQEQFCVLVYAFFQLRCGACVEHCKILWHVQEYIIRWHSLLFFANCHQLSP